MYLRLTAALLALAAGAAGVVVSVLLLRSVPGPAGGTAGADAPAASPAEAPAVPGGRIATPSDPGFPSPPPGALVLAREAGRDALALAVADGFVRVSVLGPAGDGVRGLEVSLQFGRGYLQPTDSCGAGCYQLETQGLPDSPVTVRLGGDAYRFELPSLPAPDGGALVARAEETWNGLKTLVWHERLASSPTNVLHTVYRAVAPDGLEYTTAGGSAAVIIGGERWDSSAPGAPWHRSEQDPPVRQPQPFWARAEDVHVLGGGRVGGRSVARVSFFDPSTPAWFEASIDPESGRTLTLDMTAAGHFMHHVYGPFDAPFRLAPPT